VKILYHHRTQAEDGQAVHIRSLIAAFRQEGHEVREQSLVSRAEEEGERAPGSSSAGRSSRWSWIGRVPRCARELAEYGYTWPARRALLRAAAAFEPDFLYERYAFGNAAGVGAAERLGLPIVLEVNSPMVLELAQTRGLAWPRLARRVERRIFRRATLVCVVTEVLGEMLAEMGVDRERLLVTPNGVHPEQYADPDPAAARSELGLPAEVGPILGFVGYYRDWHRLDAVVLALASSELEEAHLVLIGEGPAEEGLRRAAREAGVEARVHFTGSWPHARIPSLLPAFDVALVPAINPYASPLKLHEYMAAGLATVAPDQPNLREVLEHGQNALLVPPGDPAALCAAITSLVGDPGLRTTLGEAAARTIVERDLTWRGNARAVLARVEGLV